MNNRNSKEEYFTDEEMKELVKNELTNIPPPPLSSDEAWNKISKQLEKEKSNKSAIIFNKKPILLIGSVASILLLVLLSYNPSGSSAFFRVTDFYHKIQGSVVQIFIGEAKSRDTNAPANSEYSVEDLFITNKSMSFNEAQENTSFRLKQPLELPESFVLNETVVSFDQDGNALETNQFYIGDGRNFIINQRPIIGDFGIGTSVNSGSASYEEININGDPASLVISKEHQTAQLMIVSQIDILLIQGQLSRDEIMKIANSIK